MVIFHCSEYNSPSREYFLNLFLKAANIIPVFRDNLANNKKKPMTLHYFINAPLGLPCL